MGHRMELYVDPSIAQNIIEISKSFGVAAKIIGRVEANYSKKLTIISDHGVFEY
jgi:phosphoribosylformylglycinamidine cyclo-ligase